MDHDEAVEILVEVLRREMRQGRIILSGREWAAYDLLRREQD